MAKIRISELPYLASASAGAVLPVVDNGVTYKTDLNVLETAMIYVISASIDNRLDFLESFSSSFNSFSSSIDIKIAEATNEQSLVGFVTTASFNSFTSSYLTDSASFDSRIQNHISSTAYISESYTEFVYSYHAESSSFSSRIDAATNEQYIAGLLLTSSYQLDSASFNNRINNFTASVAIDTSSFATTGSNIFYGDQIITSSLFVSGTSEFGGDLVPKEARGATLGTELRPFKGIFVSSGSINIASDIIGEPNTSISNVGGNLEISAGGMKLVGSASFIAATGSFEYLSGSFNHVGTANRIGDTIITGSLNLTGSTSFTELTGSLSAFSESVDSRFDTLESFSSSADNRYVLSGSTTQTTWDNIANKPNDIISSSQQISDYGFVTGAFVTINEYNQFTQSIYEITQSFYNLSGSFGSIDFTGINTITASYLEFTQSYYSASASFDSRIDSLQNATSSYLTSLDGTISSSNQIAELGFITGVLDIDNYVTTSSFNSFTQSLSGTISSSTQISEFGFVSGSYETTGRGIISSSLQTTDWGYTTTSSFNLFTSSLAGAISSSAQISAFGFISSSQTIDTASFVTTSSFNYFTQSYQSDSASFDTRIIAATNEQNLSGYATTASLNIISASAWGAFQSASSYSSSLVTSISASNYTIGINSASVSSISGAFATTISNLSLSGGGASVTTSDTAPTSPTNGDLWWKSNDGNLYVYYDSYWVIATDTISSLPNGVVSSSAQITTAGFATTGSNTFTGTNTFNDLVTFAASSGDEGGEILLAKSQTNNSLTGSGITIDSYQNRLRIFEQGGAARGVHIDLTKTPGGVAGELTWKSSGLVNAGTFVSLDNIKATVTTSGQRGLSLAAVTSNFSTLIGGNYAVNGGANGSSGGLSVTTTATTSVFNWNFTGAGDISTYIITDTTNSRGYRIVLQIGASYNNNLIVIERLY